MARHGNLRLKIEERDPARLRPAGRALRKHSRKQIAQIEASIRAFGFLNPLLVDPEGKVVCGHGRLLAAQALKLESVPTIRLEHMSAEERRTYALAENKLAELSQWDEALVSLELQDLDKLELDFELEITGIEGAELERYLAGPQPADDTVAPALEKSAVTRPGDIWHLGDHRLICGDALDANVFTRLMQGEAARMIFADPPYNVKVDGFVTGRGAVTHREFSQAAGEMSSGEFAGFLELALGNAAVHAMDGAIAFTCMDWRHLPELNLAGRAVFSEFKNLCVWAKTNAGLGDFYRSQHELIAVFKKGGAKHVNTFGLGKSGRLRSNVWSYPGVNGFGPDREAALAQHPTQKPLALVADAIRDVSRRGEIVLDPFAGSGTTAMAAERTRRRARLVEIDPLYCDVICRRWEAAQTTAAMLEGAKAFQAVAAERQQQEEPTQ